MRDKKTILSYFVILSFLVCALIGTSYGFILQNTNDKPNVFMTGILDISFKDNTESIDLDNSYPMKDEEGMNTDGYTFTITNTGNIPAYFLIYLDDQSSSNNSILRNQLKYSLNNSSPNILPYFDLTKYENETDVDYSLYFGLLNVNESKTFNLKLWINESETVFSVANKEYIGKVVVKTVNRAIWED